MKMLKFERRNIGGDGMKRLMLLLIMVMLVMTVWYCGGPKKLTQEEYNQLSPQERVLYLEKQIEKNSTDVELKKKLYKEYLQMGMEERAIPVMKQILLQDPYQAEVQFDYGSLMMKRGETKLAYEAFRETLKSPGGSYYTSQISQFLGGKYLIQEVTDDEADEAFPSFSPDGSKIVYQTNKLGNWDIVERDLASGEEKFLVNSYADEELPCYSPDGKLLVFTSNADDRRPIDNKFKVREIYVKDLQSGFEKNLTETVADDWLPRFSHDGKYILFVSERSDLRNVPYTEKQSDIFVMENDGDFQTQLTNQKSNEGGACFSIDDDKIFFHSNQNGSYDIFMMKSDGSTPITILGEAQANEVNPMISPDGEYIVYFSDKNGNYDIYRARVDGSEIERLTFHPSNDTNPVFSPDGKSVIFHSDRNGNYDIFLINLEVITEPTPDELISRLDKLLGQ